MASIVVGPRRNLVLVDRHLELFRLDQTFALQVLHYASECLFVHLEAFVFLKLKFDAFAELDFRYVATFGFLDHVKREYVAIDGLNGQVPGGRAHLRRRPTLDQSDKELFHKYGLFDSSCGSASA